MTAKEPALPRKPRVGVIALLAIVILVFAFAIGWLGYATVAWLGYGRLQVDHRPDPLLDHFMPVYDIAERHEIRVAAPASVTYAAACAFDLQRSPIISGIFRGRELLMGAPHGTALPSSPFLEQILSFGWGVLAEQPGRELVMGAATQPWQAHVVFHALAPDRFAAFNAPDFAKITWTLEAEPLGDSTSLFRTVTRVQTTDGESRRKFRRYWSVYSPGILLIRREALRLVRADAERLYREHGVIAAARCPATAHRR